MLKNILAKILINFLKIKKMIFNINGGNFEGSNLRIKKNKIYIDGEEIATDDKVINITVNGNIDDLKVDYAESINVTGNVGSFKGMSGSVTVTGDILGNVESMSGDIQCKNLHGNAKTMSGDISKF